jgi:hypothetical protein
MGLVVALRFLSWGGGVAALCGILLVESTRHPNLLGFLTLPCLLAFYLMASGQVLLLLRLSDWPARAMAMGPLLSLILLGLPAARVSSVMVCLALGLGLWLYLGAFCRQAANLGHPRAKAWFQRLRVGLVPVLVLAVAIPGAAGPATVIGSMVAFGALLVGWRIWLAELRQSIVEREDV